jgi:hypothetical protein
MQTLPKYNKAKDVQVHIKKAYEIIDQYLPRDYVSQVYEILPKDTTISVQSIYNARKKMSKRIEIVNAMVEVAMKYKKMQEKLAKTIK